MRNKYLLCLSAFLIWMLFFDRNDIVSQVQLRMKLADYRDKKEYYEKQIKDVKREKNELGIFVAGFVLMIVFEYLFKPAQSFFGREHRRLRSVDTYTDNDLIKQWQCSCDNINMPQRNGVKGAGEKTDSLHGDFISV